MTISTNSVGNYSNAYSKPVARAKAEEAPANAKNNISVEEKKFFANLYPGQQTEILGYQSYNSKGIVSGVHVGSLFDRRG